MVDQYVVPLAEGWGVRAAISDEVSRIFDSKEDAIAYATELAQAEKSALFVQHLDGKVEKQDSFRPDSQATEIDSIRVGDEYESRKDES
jgi:hypothetical protein